VDITGSELCRVLSFVEPLVSAARKLISKIGIMKMGYQNGIYMEQTQDALQSHAVALQALDISVSATGDI
jgi:hypothetical protein